MSGNVGGITVHVCLLKFQLSSQNWAECDDNSVDVIWFESKRSRRVKADPAVNPVLTGRLRYTLALELFELLKLAFNRHFGLRM